MKTFFRIIQKLGGTVQLQHKLSLRGIVLSKAAISNWKNRGIPSNIIIHLMIIAEHEGISFTSQDFVAVFIPENKEMTLSKTKSIR